MRIILAAHGTPNRILRPCARSCFERVVSCKRASKSPTNTCAPPCVHKHSPAICLYSLTQEITVFARSYHHRIMDASDDDTGKVAAVNHDSAPSSTQWPGIRGRTPTPPLKRIIIYDCDEKTVTVRKAKSFESKFPQNNSNYPNIAF